MISDLQIWPVYQPVYHIETMEVIANEALIRSTSGTPGEIFALAKLQNKETLLDIRCFQLACENAPRHTPVFVNLLPSTLVALSKRLRVFESSLKKLPSPENLILEILEMESIKKYHEVIEAVLSLRERYGIRISLDDMANGYNRLGLLAELQPNFVKLNGPLVRNCDTDPYKQSLLRIWVDFSQSVTNVALIAETVETDAELETIIQIGIPFAQGFVFNKRPLEVLDYEEKKLYGI